MLKIVLLFSCVSTRTYYLQEHTHLKKVSLSTILEKLFEFDLLMSIKIKIIKKTVSLTTKHWDMATSETTEKKMQVIPHRHLTFCIFFFVLHALLFIELRNFRPSLHFSFFVLY